MADMNRGLDLAVFETTTDLYNGPRGSDWLC
jgi:hypothetical protein